MDIDHAEALRDEQTTKSNHLTSGDRVGNIEYFLSKWLLSHAHNLITSDCAANFTVHKARHNVIYGRIEVCHVNYGCIDFQEERFVFTS